MFNLAHKHFGSPNSVAGGEGEKKIQISIV